MMVYALLPRGSLDWDDIRIFTTFAAVEPLILQGTFVIAMEGTDELTPAWIYQLEQGRIRRYPINR
jgi:hypothetical protein